MAKKGERIPPPKTPEAAARLEAAKWKPGVSPNPGGAPNGKRVSTWLLEIGQMSAADLTKFRKRKDLPQFAKLALAAYDRAEYGGTQANGALDIVLDRTEGKVPQVHGMVNANAHAAHDLEQLAQMLTRLADARRAPKDAP